MRRAFSFLVLFSYLSLTAAAEESFWARSPQSLGRERWQVYTPRSDQLKDQAYMIHTTLAASVEPIETRRIFRELYSEFEQFKVLGQRTASWGGKPAKLMSFRARLGEQEFLGRGLVARTSEGVEVLLLVRHPKAQSKILSAFEFTRKNWPAALPPQGDSE